MKKSGIIQPHQYGFQQKHLTVIALLHTVTSCYDAMKEKKFLRLIMIDLRKAFNTVCHKKLLKKLDYYGIHGIANELISNYFLNQTQYVLFKWSKIFSTTVKYHGASGIHFWFAMISYLRQ